MFHFSRVCFGGSRVLAEAFRPFVRERVRALWAEARLVTVGCASGVDAEVRAVCPDAVVFRARDVRGVSWVEALRARSRASVRAVVPGGAFVAFFSSPESWGTFGTARFAVSVGVPVFAFALGFSPSLLPSLGSGRWVRVAAGVLGGSCLWVPHANSRGGKNA